LNGTPTVVVVIVKGIRPHVEQALERAGLAGVPLEVLRFPDQWWRNDYIKELTRLAQRWKRQRLVLL